MSPLLLVMGALLAGGLVGVAMAAAWYRTDKPATAPLYGHSAEILDWLRRANGARAACLVAPEVTPAWAAGDPPDAALLERAGSLARLALGDTREHRVDDDGWLLVAVGDGRFGCALVFEEGGTTDIAAEVAITDMRRFLSGIRERRLRDSGALEVPRDLPEWLTGGPENVEGLAFQLCEAVRDVSGRPCALVLRDPGTREVSVVAVSSGADRRLLGTRVSSTSAAGRASSGDVPIAGRLGAELLGDTKRDRRARDEEGVAFPIRDGREGVGSLVVFGKPEGIPDRVRKHVVFLVANSGPRLGRALTVRTAEGRATTDELTGLPNRRALDRAMAAHGSGPCGVLCVDLDHFKRLNDGFGHAAGDAALRHVANVFRKVLREDDLACRVGGEEFALWLPGASSNRAMEVAERVISAVRGSLLEWGGAQIQMTCSIGVAAVPDTVGRVENLLGAGDVALYRAKEAGRDRAVLAASGAR